MEFELPKIEFLFENPLRCFILDTFVINRDMLEFSVEKIDDPIDYFGGI